MKTKSTLVKTLQIFAVCIFFSSAALADTGAEEPKSGTAQKIAKMKKELAETKGQKRVKLIKKIAEMENKVLENHLQSFR